MHLCKYEKMAVYFSDDSATEVYQHWFAIFHVYISLWHEHEVILSYSQFVCTYGFMYVYDTNIQDFVQGETIV